MVTIKINELYELQAQGKYDEELEKIKQYFLENYDITEEQAKDLVSYIKEVGHDFCDFVDIMYDVMGVLDIVCTTKETN